MEIEAGPFARIFDGCTMCMANSRYSIIGRINDDASAVLVCTGGEIRASGRPHHVCFSTLEPRAKKSAIPLPSRTF